MPLAAVTPITTSIISKQVMSDCDSSSSEYDMPLLTGHSASSINEAFDTPTQLQTLRLFLEIGSQAIPSLSDSYDDRTDLHLWLSHAVSILELYGVPKEYWTTVLIPRICPRISAKFRTFVKSNHIAGGLRQWSTLKDFLISKYSI
ncbi:hypothetical protein EV182_007369 [Spiromyces aspiralis]|uniref:Uncharacterized protein n=1 Tax=Spiromyces aspiralis TaxID=68401 RepID=A0ACC1HMG2_9FUNG|nr:hypothetical protein EV182_007369 [Spiromyces aspiralis]